MVLFPISKPAVVGVSAQVERDTLEHQFLHRLVEMIRIFPSVSRFSSGLPSSFKQYLGVKSSNTVGFHPKRFFLFMFGLSIQAFSLRGGSLPAPVYCSIVCLSNQQGPQECCSEGTSLPNRISQQPGTGWRRSGWWSPAPASPCPPEASPSPCPGPSPFGPSVVSRPPLVAACDP